ncbi:late competence protein ComER [Gracilibacillus alcaliphilus]|uniref:late competence protein ComER n=1 Tax=Gracilibacillus alcaliphilus TaxID=1401441 RepID=UPI001EF7680A|nr:late competence protein ComER [Gracilibacillus alcaliphilus]MBM7678870.1 competence protein ComER [Gracilibacillus alcaliphilus]
MMKWGIIGTGNMGSILVRAFIESETIKETDCYITNRNMEKAYAIQHQYPDIQVTKSIYDLVEQTDIIYLCVKPLEMKAVLQEISPYLSEKQLLVSITSALSTEELEKLVHCQVARMVPSITNYALAGVTLVTFGSRVDAYKQDQLIQIWSNFSEVMEIDESIIRIASDLVSCGPAFFSFLAQKYIHASHQLTSITEEQATALMEKMLSGYGKLLSEQHFTLTELINKVCVKGGITGIGIAAIEEHYHDLFEHVIEATHDKFSEDKEMLAKEDTET